MKDPNTTVQLEKSRKKLMQKYKWGLITMNDFIAQLSATYQTQKSSKPPPNGG